MTRRIFLRYFGVSSLIIPVGATAFAESETYKTEVDLTESTVKAYAFFTDEEFNTAMKSAQSDIEKYLSSKYRNRDHIKWFFVPAEPRPINDVLPQTGYVGWKYIPNFSG